MATSKKATTPARKTGRAAETEPKMRLAELEALVAQKLRAAGITAATAREIAAHGDAIVNAGRLSGYTAARYGKGRWVSAAVVKRIAKLLDESK